MEATYPIVKHLAASFQERATSLGYKGKKRDAAALDYICGAATCAQAQGNAALLQHLTKIAWLVSVRGAMGLASIAAKE